MHHHTCPNGQTSPETYLEILEDLDRERLMISLEAESWGEETGRYAKTHISQRTCPKTLGEVYGMSERNVVRASVKGREFYIHKLRKYYRQLSPAYAMAPDVSPQEFDLYMAEVEACIDDGQKIAKVWQSKPMVKRHPIALKFSLTALRKCFKAWQYEMHEEPECNR
jgi:hypothetical protein